MRPGYLHYQSVLLGCAAYVNRDKSSIPTVNHSLNHPSIILLIISPRINHIIATPYNFFGQKLQKSNDFVNGENDKS